MLLSTHATDDAEAFGWGKRTCRKIADPFSRRNLVRVFAKPIVDGAGEQAEPLLLRVGPAWDLVTHPLSTEIMLCRQGVMCPATEREIVHGSRSTARVGRHMVELQPCSFSASLATDVVIGAASGVALPNRAANGGRNAAPRRRGVFVPWRFLVGRAVDARGFRVRWFRSRWASW